MRRRARAAGWHLLICVAIAAIAAALVFLLWYPGDYRLLSGGRNLFLLIVSVDIVLGPLLTFVVFDLKKGWPHLRKDLAIIGALQLAALAYGLHTVYEARPIATVFEVDRFRVVAANQVRTSELSSALPQYQRLPLTGPWLLSVRRARPGLENAEALFMALEGTDTSQRPSFWLPYDGAKAEALAKARPLSALLARYPDRRTQIQQKLRDLSLEESGTRFLPVIARGDWVALLDSTGVVAGYLPLDGFF